MRSCLLLLLSCFFLLGGCVSNESTTTSTPQPKEIKTAPAPLETIEEALDEANLEEYKSLTFNVKMGVSPSQPDWVLFSNGTYIIFPRGTSDREMRKAAKKIIGNYKSQSLKVRKSPMVKGWIVYADKGIFNYVSLKQAGERTISDKDLIRLGEQNILADQAKPFIVHINSDK